MKRSWRFLLRGAALVLYLGAGLSLTALPLGAVLLVASPFLFLCGMPTWLETPAPTVPFWTGAGVGSCVLGVAFLVLVLWVRRGFCRFVCPLGTLQDGIGKLRVLPAPPARVYHRFHFVAGILAFYTLAAVWCGAAVFVWLDPLVIFTAAVHGMAWAWCVGGLVLLLSLFFPKLWCTAICPCGSVQEFLWRIPRLARPVAHSPQAPTAFEQEAASSEQVTPQAPTVFKQEAASQALTAEAASSEQVTQSENQVSTAPLATVSVPEHQAAAATSQAPSSERRGFLHILGSLLILAPCAYLMKGIHSAASRIRPPGVGTAEARFLARCTRCGNCLAVCPTHLLRPVQISDSAEAVGTPEAVFEPVGEPADSSSVPAFCKADCTLCAQVCPTHAIPILPPKERRQFQMARVAFELTHCRVYEQHECRSASGNALSTPSRSFGQTKRTRTCPKWMRHSARAAAVAERFVPASMGNGRSPFCRWTTRQSM